ncbi:hypothetical protein [Parabacteroides distasonis]|jgi:hypothetical protein|uniref:hypothetical protein n=1 Tax=Parabacteroides distasonis TaxID=823 RepID=UPI0034A2AD8D
MKTIEIEGIRLTEDMIYRIKCMQEENGTGFEEYIHDLDKTVSFIATELIDPSVDYEKKALHVIMGLCQLKEVLAEFSGKEAQV